MKQFTLPNGINCVIQKNDCHQSVTATIMFRVGSRDEPKDYYGLTHFAEHMFFKGTKKRPKAEMISSAIDQYGGIINAVTDYDTTYYYVKLNRQYLDVALDILSDMLFNSLFESKEIQSEKEVVVEELQLYRSNPSRYINTMMSEMIYRGTTMEHDVGGDVSIIRSATREKFLHFVNHYYRPENTIISLVGNFPVSEKEMIDKVGNFFNHRFNYESNKKSRKSKFPLARKLFPQYREIQQKPRFKCRVFKEIKNTYLMLGFPAYPYRSKDFYVSSVIAAILGGGMSSRLFLEVREKRGLVYKIKTDIDAYQDIGSFTIVASTSGTYKKIAQVIKIILNELKKLKQGEISAKEVKKAKRYLIGSDLMKRESSSYLSEQAAYDLLTFGRLIDSEQYLKQIERVSKAQIVRVANDLFRPNQLNVCTVSHHKLTQIQLLPSNLHKLL